MNWAMLKVLLLSPGGVADELGGDKLDIGGSARRTVQSAVRRMMPQEAQRLKCCNSGTLRHFASTALSCNTHHQSAWSIFIFKPFTNFVERRSQNICLYSHILFFSFDVGGDNSLQRCSIYITYIYTVICNKARFTLSYHCALVLC